MTIHAHIFTDIDTRLWTKQIPNKRSEYKGVRFTFGLDIDPNADVLIVYNRTSWSIPTTLPVNRTVFFGSEPDVIHSYAVNYMNQFGLVLTQGNKPIIPPRVVQNYCSTWFAGVDFANLDAALGYDHFKALQPPTKDDKISIVTSTKSDTEYQKKRLAFIDILKDRIPDQIEFYGRGFNPVSDKMEAMLPHKYHLTLENGAGKYSWTEKLSDPLLCWALPFYVGCENVEEELPPDSIVRIDLDDPEQAIKLMMEARDKDLWTERKETLAKARSIILEDFNLIGLCAKLTKQAMSLHATPPRKRLIRSEKSLWPEDGARGSLPEMMFRSVLLILDPAIELKLGKYRKSLRAKKKRKYRSTA